MSYEPSYHEALDSYVAQTYIRERFGRKVIRDGKWVRFETPEKQLKKLKESRELKEWEK